jgi:hypothetical protein
MKPDRTSFEAVVTLFDERDGDGQHLAASLLRSVAARWRQPTRPRDASRRFVVDHAANPRLARVPVEFALDDLSPKSGTLGVERLLHALSHTAYDKSARRAGASHDAGKNPPRAAVGSARVRVADAHRETIKAAGTRSLGRGGDQRGTGRGGGTIARGYLPQPEMGQWRSALRSPYSPLLATVTGQITRSNSGRSQRHRPSPCTVANLT